MDFTQNIKKYFPAPTEDQDNSLPFIVKDKESFTKATDALVTAGLIAFPPLFILKMVHTIGTKIAKKYRTPIIDVIEKKRLTFEQTYDENVKMLYGLLDQRSAIVEVIEKMINPLIYNQADLELKQEYNNRRLHECEMKILAMEEMLKKVYGKSPSIQPLPIEKESWKASMVEASKEIIKTFRAAKKANTKQYKDLRDASDEFFDQHEFKHKQGYTKDLLYANVKKENMMTPE